MSITDELREWYRDRLFMGNGWAEIDAIADRIDAEHEKAEQDLIDANNQMEQLCECSIELPKDADGEYIHVGDAVTCGATVWTVTGLKFLGEGWGICCTVYNEYGGSGTSVYPPSDLRHHHEPTVEDVLWEFVSEFNRDDTELCDEEIIERFAAKFRLAKEGE